MLIIDDELTVRLSGAVIDIHWHGERLRALPMALRPEEYTVGTLAALARAELRRYKHEVNNHDGFRNLAGVASAGRGHSPS